MPSVYFKTSFETSTVNEVDQTSFDLLEKISTRVEENWSFFQSTKTDERIKYLLEIP